MSDIKVIRRVEYDGQVFASKQAAMQYKSRELLNQYGTVDELCANADAVIAALKIFATPMKRTSKKQKANGPAITAKPGKGAAQPTA